MGITERKEREKQRRRQEILRAAEKVFFTKGIDHSTMDDVAEEAELSKGTLYLYFKSKEEIHWEIAQKHMLRVTEDMMQALDDRKNAVENLQIMARIFAQHFDEEHEAAHSILFFQACDLNNLNLNHEQIRHTFIHDSPIHLVTKYVEQGMAEGLIRNDISENALSSTLWAQLMGVLQIITLKRDLFELIGVSREDIIESHIKIALNGILANGSN
ncbi:MAG: TetR/AcrR family transcriptional regulator [Bacteroidales bacterium]|jgi:AcrR family transcriptional regulator